MAFLRHEITVILSLWASLLYVAQMSLPLVAEAPKRSQYIWNTGAWGVCVASDCGSVGLQSRSVWCVHSEGWSTHQSNCFPSDRPPHQRVCVKMCEWQKDLFEWRLSPWGPCTPSPLLPANRCVTAQRGVQKRDVVCVKRTNSTSVSLHVCEAFSSPPEREQACLLPCPIDCVVSAFTHWSTCSRTCGSALQQRTRHVLATPLYGGADCPILTQTRPCNHDNAHPAPCPSDQQEYSYSLWVGPWSPCRLKGTAPIGKTTVDFNFGHDGKKTVKAPFTIKRHTESIPHQNHYEESGHKVSWEITIGCQTRQLRCTRSDGKNAMLRQMHFLSKCTRRRKRYVKQADGECSSSSTCSSCSWLTKDTENLKEQFIMSITLTPKPEASTSNYPKNIGIVITGLGNIAAALLCPPWLDLRAESRLSPLYTFEVFQKLFLELDQQSPIPLEQTSGLK